VIPPPIEIEAERLWDAAQARPRQLLFLGRIEPYHKGLDRLCAIARILPDLEVLMHGVVQYQSAKEVEELKAGAPANAHFNEPVYGTDKVELLLGSSLYVQPSRFEGFAMSLGEAMLLGVPVAISESLPIAPMFASLELGLVISEDVGQAAKEIGAALDDTAALQRWSENGRRFALERFSSTSAAEKLVEIYRRD
jgi:glycosyltransferase involved in cell wall biosynthesis